MTDDPGPASTDPPGDTLLCHRCGRTLVPGGQTFYVVNIEAYADPSSPAIQGDQDVGEVRREIESLLEQMAGMSEQELMDQVYRRFTIHLCPRCYAGWIENPAGG